MPHVEVLYIATYYTRFVLGSLEMTSSHFVNRQLVSLLPVTVEHACFAFVEHSGTDSVCIVTQ